MVRTLDFLFFDNTTIKSLGQVLTNPSRTFCSTSNLSNKIDRAYWNFLLLDWFIVIQRKIRTIGIYWFQTMALKREKNF